jgi:hypothetical protein
MVACVPEAPRTNPLEPGPNYSLERATISGTVFTRYQPSQPLDNADILLLPNGEIRLTDLNGFYRFENLNPGHYQLIVQKEKYVGDTTSVIINSHENVEEINFFLNAVPEIRRISYYSEHIDQWWPGAISRAFLTVVVEDPDGAADIDSVQYSLPAFNLKKSFEPTARPDSFIVDIEDLDLPQSNLQHLVEKESHVLIRDNAGAAISGGPYFLRRIIEEAPQPSSPANLQVVSPYPTLVWQTITLPFEFTFLAQVFRITGGVPVLIHTSPELPANQLSYNFPDSLGSGNFFWTIGVRDNLNNFSRSKEASFVVP